LLKSVGGNKDGWLRLTLAGDPDNKTGQGAKVEIWAGLQRQTVQIGSSAGYLGQGPAAAVIGLGTEERADVVRIRWPTGLLQDEIRLAVGPHAPIEEGQAGDSTH
jgi:hypothetical protein